MSGVSKQNADPEFLDTSEVTIIEIPDMEAYERMVQQQDEGPSTSRLPFSEAPCQLTNLDIFNEIRALANSFAKHEEAMEKRFGALEKENRELRIELKHCQAKLDAVLKNTATANVAMEEVVAATCPREGIMKRANVEFPPIDCEADLRQLNDSLKTDPNYKSQFLGYLLRRVTRTDPANRLHDTIDLIFTKRFFATMNWSGFSMNPGVKKLGLSCFGEVVNIFQEVGGNNNLELDLKYVNSFLRRKLQHASERIHIKDGKRTSSHMSK